MNLYELIENYLFSCYWFEKSEDKEYWRSSIYFWKRGIDLELIKEINNDKGRI